MTASLGLLLDVDGPLASTVTRTLRVPSIANDLAALAAADIPVVFNTGRSHTFLIDRVLPPLVEAGLPPTAPVWGVGEKGGTWFSLDPSASIPTVTPLQLDDALRPPGALSEQIRQITADYEALMFWDDTKQTMISVEQHVDVSSADYLAAQPEVVTRCQSAIDELGLAASFHIIPTIISIDIEHTSAGKALGARRALDLVAERGTPPTEWFTAGDSPSDFDMATWLHENGYAVTHLDVRPDGDDPQTAYPVIRERPGDGAAEDDLTARHLARLRNSLTS